MGLQWALAHPVQHSVLGEVGGNGGWGRLGARTYQQHRLGGSLPARSPGSHGCHGLTVIPTLWGGQD